MISTLAPSAATMAAPPLLRAGDATRPAAADAIGPKISAFE
jgi:hypothetical protein